MMTAVGQKADFSGAKRSGNTPAVLTQRATPKIRFLSTAPWGCGDNSAGGCVGFAFTARKGMLAQSRLACDPFLTATVSMRLNQRFLKP
jgi:hypothetical protein